MVSPWELLVQWKLDYKKHCWVLSGEYCVVHNEPSQSNMMVPCTHEAIMLGVLSFLPDYGARLEAKVIYSLPVPDRVIRKVNVIGICETQGRKFWFLNWGREPFE